ncbi:hypothetical protein SAMN05443429_10558 [Cruoricaptor ignavus]|uniref:CAAX prenyl protease 2/Lysostaphin resistance protein A-like domain-containing protein n=2 Tax=Cruoricaptor ignavus TaxID=1118202 RepID=A0A1M6EC35_9FLAO|nr:hypothetical protein SAMN05443429_10558 [Cruoricaptor ignavus]
MLKKSFLPEYIFDLKSFLIMLAGMFAASLFPALIAGICLLVFQKDLQTEPFFMIVLNSSGLLGAIFAFDFFSCRPAIGEALNFNLKPSKPEVYLVIFPMMLGMMLISEFLVSLVPVTGPVFGKWYDTFARAMEMVSMDTPTMLVMTVGFAPVLEEIIFRGIIQKGLQNKGWQPISAIIFSSLLFAIIHGNPWQAIGAFLLGFVLGFVYWRTGSLLNSILLHAFNNLVSCLLILSSNSESFEIAFNIEGWKLFFAGCLIFGVAFYFFNKLPAEDSRGQQFV